MGLEAATFISQLVPTNPLASDKKNVGDDHLRLLKAALQGSFPNSSRAFRIPEILSKNANYTVLEADENKIILCDTTSAFTLTLPTPSFSGWMVRVMKSSYDINPVFVAPPSGNISASASVAKIRCNVPFVEYVFLWTGSSFIRISGGDAAVGVLESYMGGTPPIGYALAQGQSLLRADFPELFAWWGTSWGAVDGTHFSAPNPINRFLVGAGSIYTLGAVGGSNAPTIGLANLPSTPIAVSVTDTRAWRTNSGTVLSKSGPGGLSVVGTDVNTGGDVNVVVISGAISGSVALGSDTPIDTRPPYLGVNYIFRMC